MTSSNPEPRKSPAVAPPVFWWLRLEGLSVTALSAFLFAHSGASWWLFAALWLVPDISIFGYMAGPRWGAYCYNTAHSYVLPVALAIIAMQFHRTAWLPFALIWFNHIGVDRLCGYGLKYPAGFGFTHLNSSQKRPLPSASAHPL
jgi:Domain of unknown function (DUF4260)